MTGSGLNAKQGCCRSSSSSPASSQAGILGSPLSEVELPKGHFPIQADSWMIYMRNIYL